MTALPIDTASEVVAGNDRALDVIDALVTRTGVTARGGCANWPITWAPAAAR